MEARGNGDKERNSRKRVGKYIIYLFFVGVGLEFEEDYVNECHGCDEMIDV